MGLDMTNDEIKAMWADKSGTPYIEIRPEMFDSVEEMEEFMCRYSQANFSPIGIEFVACVVMVGVLVVMLFL